MILETVRKTIEEKRLIEKGDTVICAVSGGADSVCLLEVMSELKNEYNLEILVANVNHLIRGEESDRDSEFVKELCKKAGIAFYYREYDVVRIAKERKIGEEECGRILRYEFFEELSRKFDGAKIATAHNLNDNAETLLFRLIRGSSLQGLSGIKYKRDAIIRPLLDVSRTDIEAYLNFKGISWCEDSTNKLDLYTRNKIRLCAMPLLEEISKEAQKKIAMASSIISDDNDFMLMSAQEIIEKCFFGECLLITPLEGLHISLRRRIAYEVLKKWDVADLTFSKIESFLDFIEGENGKRFTIDSYRFAEKNYDKITLCKECEVSINESLLEEGKCIKGEGWSLSGYIACERVKKTGNDIAVFDAEKLSFPLTVRFRRDGDRIKLKGVSGKKKISDVFTDAKIDRFQRNSIPIVEKDGEVLFVSGVRQSESFSVSNDTEKFLIINFTKER